jgi:putative ubiquitin-RnfH superfamily antitoxin RatB of RatAB toxin-antitoxin module
MNEINGPEQPVIRVEVAYAEPQHQWLVAVRLPAGSTVAEAIERSGICDQVPGIEIKDRRVGVFYQPCSLNTLLREGDRVEIYRPLLSDPKDVRRQRAAGGVG